MITDCCHAHNSCYCCFSSISSKQSLKASEGKWYAVMIIVHFTGFNSREKGGGVIFSCDSEEKRKKARFQAYTLVGLWSSPRWSSCTARKQKAVSVETVAISVRMRNNAMHRPVGDPQLGAAKCA